MGMKKLKLVLSALIVFCGLGLADVEADAAPKKMADGTIFDAEYYANTYPDVKAAFGTNETLLYQHYKNYGRAEGRKACEIAFDPVYYASTYPDVKAAFGDNADLLYQHYIQYGIAEGRKGTADTDVEAVKETVAATPQAGGTVLVPVVIEAGDEMYVRRGERAYFGRDLDYQYPIEPGSTFDPANGFVRSDWSSDPTYCALRDYMVAQIMAAPAGETRGKYPIVLTWNSREDCAQCIQIYKNLVVDLYKSGLCRAVDIFSNPADDYLGERYPREIIILYGIWK